jgi:hypothetical protein
MRMRPAEGGRAPEGEAGGAEAACIPPPPPLLLLPRAEGSRTGDAGRMAPPPPPPPSGPTREVRMGLAGRATPPLWPGRPLRLARRTLAGLPPGGSTLSEARSGEEGARGPPP